MFTIELLKIDDINPEMLDSFDRHQKTSKVVYYANGKLQEKIDVFEDNWTIERKREIVAHFRETIKHGGAVIIAVNESDVIGFAVIEPNSFGQSSTYRELSFLHVTASQRGQKVGEKLFKKAKETAKSLGAEKLYIGAHPSAATQNFYKKMGCVLAKEINNNIYKREVRDIQIEAELINEFSYEGGGILLGDNEHKQFLEKSIELAAENVMNDGGPFGAVIVRNGIIISTGVNKVTISNDPTAHAEIIAIREACQKLKTFNLEGCILYTSCEPCPMCLGAIYWSRLESVYFAADRKDAAAINFDDDFIYTEIPLEYNKRSKPFFQYKINHYLKPFSLWKQKIDKVEY